MSLDAGAESDLPAFVLADWHTPETELESRYTNELLEHALERLRAEFSRKGKAALFDVLDPLLEGAGRGNAYRQVSRQLHVPVSRAKVTVFRMSHRLRALLLEELRAINGDASDLRSREDYWRILFRQADPAASGGRSSGSASI